MKRFRICFDQVNPIVYTIDAKTEKEAVLKARTRWTKGFSHRFESGVTELKYGES